MKKAVSFTPIVLMFVILAGLFIFMCLPEKQSTTDTAGLYFFRTRGLYCAVLGGILMAAFYHLTLYIFRRREKVYLIFSLFCLVSVLQFIFMRNGLNEIFGWIPSGVFLKRFRGVMSFLYHNAITILGLYVLSRHFLLKHKKVLMVYIVLGIAYYCLIPTSAPFYEPVSILIVISVSLFITTIGFMSPLLRENRWTLLYFISFVFYIVIGIMNNLIFANVFFMPGLVSNLFMVLSQSILLSKNYTNAFELVEETDANLEQIVDERTKDLQGTNNAMKELVGNISHDLKTPLAIMSVNLEELFNLSQTLSDEDYQRCVRTAYKKNLDLQRLIQNLMEINRIETNRGLLRPEWVSLLKILSIAQDKYDDYLNSKGIFFEIYCTDDVEIYADLQRIWSVFDNVIYNAARYTESGGVITINTTECEKTIDVVITDTGSGIAPEHVPHVFERFYKASAARSTGDGNSGLGLYIVKSIMEAIGGNSTAESELGKGTSVILSFKKKAGLIESPLLF